MTPLWLFLQRLCDNQSCVIEILHNFSNGNNYMSRQRENPPLSPSAKWSARDSAISLRWRQNGQRLNKQIHYGNTNYGVASFTFAYAKALPKLSTWSYTTLFTLHFFVPPRRSQGYGRYRSTYTTLKVWRVDNAPIWINVFSPSWAAKTCSSGFKKTSGDIMT